MFIVFSGKPPLIRRIGRGLRCGIAVPAVALVPLAGVRAQAPDPLLVDIAPCVNVESVLERLACYDDLASAARPADDDAGGEDRFGLPTEARPEPADTVDEIRSEVTALREILPGRLEITLANGQVWRQTASDRYRLQVGHVVRVYPSRFGRYYRLTAEPIRGFVQVERVR